MNLPVIRLPLWNRNSSAALAPPADPFNVDADYLTAPCPKILWIELTSKCPFDCIFCTRRVRFGTGRNLDFEVYRRLIGELESPDFIGLNYSGESIHYPRLLEAIELAVSTGASTELVTAFSTVSKPLLERIVASGLDRLAVSLHTMDAAQYKEIYRFGSLDLLTQRVHDFVEIKSALGVQKPRLDFCFVAMKGNLDQLLPVVDYAETLGVAEVSIHPIIGRHLIPQDFSNELASNRLRDEFKDSLRNTLASVQAAHPGFTLNVLNPDLDPHPRLSHTPRYFSRPLPAGARIHSCDQSPFESVHILASGNVVVCEVHDEVSLGNLHEQSLRDIWHGETYREFRRKYVNASVPECRNCVWKLAYVPSPWTSSIVVADGMRSQFLRGWHGHEGSGVLWSKKQGIVVLRNPQSNNRIRIAGILPAAPASRINRLAVMCNGVAIGEIRNDSREPIDFDTIFTLAGGSADLYLTLSTEFLYRPSLHSSSSDSRDLGIGLRRIEVCA